AVANNVRTTRIKLRFMSPPWVRETERTTEDRPSIGGRGEKIQPAVAKRRRARPAEARASLGDDRDAQHDRLAARAEVREVDAGANALARVVVAVPAQAPAARRARRHAETPHDTTRDIDQVERLVSALGRFHAQHQRGASGVRQRGQPEAAWRPRIDADRR